MADDLTYTCPNCYRHETKQLLDRKTHLLQTTELLESKTSSLEELTAERHKRLKEKRLLLELLQGVVKDIDSIAEMEVILKKECEDLKSAVEQERALEYEPLHEQVNILRSAKGMTKIPHLQQDIDNELAKRLQERREEWQNGTPSSSSASVSAPTSSSRPASRKTTSSTATQRARTKKRRKD
ncbi:hypothetical protein DM01DRAFT_1022371 [Hesseltinella vesiculosa]|uniref:Uncharacterized protein n=1 Tax=Hesseltinella vesiculosa TaxID=101127 RepID=A0A1X2GJV9_9FUNG|nr:hypothetical protein DM01DRAFT_1022371 [Hesseltinella vesiculosa]